MECKSYLCSMESTRQQKIAKLLQKEMAGIFLGIGKDHFPGTLISVSKVRVSPDLGLAKIYLSIFPVAQGNPVMDFVRLNSSSLRGALGHAVGNQLRITPELMFFNDDSLEYEENIDRLLRGGGESPIK